MRRACTPSPPPSALATETVAQLSSAVAAAHALGLAVVLCPVLDPNWDILPQGSRSSDSPVSTWRGTIGSGFTSQGEWDAFFSSFRAWAWPYLAAAAHAGVATIQVSSELNYAFMQQEPLWRALIADIRALPFAGAVSIAVDTSVAVSLPWLDALDVVGVDVYAGLGAELPLGTPPTVYALVASYACDRAASSRAAFLRATCQCRHLGDWLSIAPQLSRASLWENVARPR